MPAIKVLHSTTWLSNAAISTGKYRCGKLSSGKLIQCTVSGEDTEGIMLKAPDAADISVEVLKLGVCPVVLGATVSAGAVLMSDGSGRAIAATTGKTTIGRLGDTGGTVGQIVEAFIGIFGAVH